MYRTIKLKNGKNYSVPEAVADEYEGIRLNMEEKDKDKENDEMEMEKDPKKKLEMEGKEEEDMKKKDMEHPEKEEEKKDMKKKDMEMKEKKDEDKVSEPGEEEYLDKKKDMKKKDMEHPEKEKEEEKKDMGKHKMNSENEIETLRGENKALKAKLNASESKVKQKTEVKERIKILNSASEILGKSADELMDYSNTDLKIQVVESIYPDIKTDGETDESISGMFEVATADKSKSYTKLLDNAIGSTEKYLEKEKVKGEGVGDMKEMEKKAFEERKNSWQKPINKGSGDYSKSSQGY